MNDIEIGKAVKRLTNRREAAVLRALNRAEEAGWNQTSTQQYLNWTYRWWTIQLMELRQRLQGVRWTDDKIGAAIPHHFGGPVSGSLIRRTRRQGLDGYQWQPAGRPKKAGHRGNVVARGDGRGMGDRR